MKKSNKFFIVVVLILSLSFIACGGGSDGDSIVPSGGFDGVISGEVKKAIWSDDYSEVKQVAARVYDENFDEVWIAFANLTNGSFTLTLPSTVETMPISSIYGWADGNVKISNESARVNEISRFECFSSLDEINESNYEDYYIGYLDYIKVNTSNSSFYSYVAFTYSDSDVVITGSETDYDDFWDEEERYNYNISLEEGWNKVFFTGKATNYGMSFSVSTKHVSGLGWYYLDDDWKSFPNLTKNTQVSEKNLDVRKIRNKFRGLK